MIALYLLAAAWFALYTAEMLCLDLKDADDKATAISSTFYLLSIEASLLIVHNFAR